MALQLLKLFSLFLLLFLFSLCLSRPYSLTHENRSVQIPELVAKGEVPFKLGQEFKYNVTGYKYNDGGMIFKAVYSLIRQKPYWMAFKGEKISEWGEVYRVESSEEIENKSSYKIRVKHNGTVLKPSWERFYTENLLYYDKATGELLRAELFVDSPSPQILLGENATEYEFGPSQIFSSWMLDLKQNPRMNKYNITLEFIGSEKVFDRSCFKVKLIASNYEGIYWVDSEERVLVKGEYISRDENVRYVVVRSDF